MTIVCYLRAEIHKVYKSVYVKNTVEDRGQGVYLHVCDEEGDGGREVVKEEDENEEPVSVVEVEYGEGSVIVSEGEGGSGRQGPVGGPPMNLTSPM